MTGLVGLLLTICLACQLFLYAHSPLGDHNPCSVNVSKGETFYHIAQIFENHRLINNTDAFSILARVSKADTQIKSGSYQLSPAMSPSFILWQLTAGNVELIKVVFPEGYTISLMAPLLEEANIVTQKEFLDYAYNPQTARSLGIEADSLEGYLFPDTYYFSPLTSPSIVVKTMLKRFWTVFNQSFIHRASELGFSIHDVVTFASIVEKETGQPEERPMIASVFHNRLKRNMRLESDPTVIYGIQDFDGNLTREHLKTTTPYNTYRIKGLPQGPIANPGEEAIRATLYPDTTRYLYFVSKQDGTHHFSTTLKSHNQAVDLYQRTKQSRPNNG